MKTGQEIYLTRAEEDVMQILWKIERGFVKDLIEWFPDPKPAYNTVSTIIRILESKGFVSHKAYGKSHEYFPMVSKDEYSKKFLKNFMKGYFNNSFQKMVSFFSTQEEINIQELEETLKLMQQHIQKTKNGNS